MAAQFFFVMLFVLAFVHECIARYVPSNIQYQLRVSRILRLVYDLQSPNFGGLINTCSQPSFTFLNRKSW